MEADEQSRAGVGRIGVASSSLSLASMVVSHILILTVWTLGQWSGAVPCRLLSGLSVDVIAVI